MLVALSYKLFAGVGYAGHTCVGHYGAGFAVKQTGGYILATLVTAELVVAHHRLAYREVGKEFLSYSCILCGDKIDLAERFNRSR